MDVQQLQRDNQELKDRVYSMELQLQEMLLTHEEQNRLHTAETSAKAEANARLERELAEARQQQQEAGEANVTFADEAAVRSAQLEAENAVLRA